MAERSGEQRGCAALFECLVHSTCAKSGEKRVWGCAERALNILEHPGHCRTTAPCARKPMATAEPAVAAAQCAPAAAPPRFELRARTASRGDEDEEAGEETYEDDGAEAGKVRRDTVAQRSLHSAQQLSSVRPAAAGPLALSAAAWRRRLGAHLRAGRRLWLSRLRVASPVSPFQTRSATRHPALASATRSAPARSRRLRQPGCCAPCRAVWSAARCVAVLAFPALTRLSAPASPWWTCRR